jgi:hypothetical protein
MSISMAENKKSELGSTPLVNLAISSSLATRTRKRRRSKREDPYPDIVLERSYLVELPIEVFANVSSLCLHRYSALILQNRYYNTYTLLTYSNCPGQTATYTKL